RSLQIYAAHILISGLALALLAGVAYLTENPLILEWHNAASFFQDPAHTQMGIVLLTHQLGYFDILPLYVVLMLVAPAFVIIDRFAKPLLVPLSLALYFASLTVPFTAPAWPVEGQWFFNPFTWQAILYWALCSPATRVSAALCAATSRPSDTLRRRSWPPLPFSSGSTGFLTPPDCLNPSCCFSTEKVS